MKLLLLATVLVLVSLCSEVNGKDAEQKVDEESLYSDEEPLTKSDENDGKAKPDTEETRNEGSLYSDEEDLSEYKENYSDINEDLEEPADENEGNSLKETDENDPKADAIPEIPTFEESQHHATTMEATVKIVTSSEPWGRRRRRWSRRRRSRRRRSRRRRSRRRRSRRRRSRRRRSRRRRRRRRWIRRRRRRWIRRRRRGGWIRRRRRGGWIRRRFIRVRRIRLRFLNPCRRRRRRYRGGRNVGGGRIRSQCLKTATLSANIARGKPAYQSSQCCGGTPRRAVDGNDNPNWNGGSCTHTHYRANSWWMVDLKASYWIGQIVITNRGDCCGSRLRGAEIHVGNSRTNGGTSNALCRGGLRVPQGQSRTFTCTQSRQGRFVTIRKPGWEYLTLCEVQVFPLHSVNIARGKPAHQISIGRTAGRAVDGNTRPQYGYGSCTHTRYHRGAWWMVDLQAVYPIGKIVVTNRGDCCGARLNPFEIRVGNSKHNGGTSNPVCNNNLNVLQGKTRSFNCKTPSRGRYLTISVAKSTYLTLCEVQVFPEDLDSALAKCWAPKLYLKSNEKYFPSSVDFFLPHVSMYNGGRRKVQTHLSAYNLQTGASNWYLSSNARLKGYNSKLPFFSGQDPRTHSVPTYCLVRHHGLFTDFVYWFFRPYNYGKNVCIGYITPCFGGCVGKRRMFGNHVGDWEHVTVRLYNNLPSRMYVGAHNFGGEYTWNGYTFVKGSERIKISHDGHPVIYAAEGSHGNWVANKRYVYKKLKNKDTLVDYTDTGIEWRTWENLKVIPFKKHGGYTGEDTWLNFKGRWGNREMGCGIFNIFKKVANECGLNNGPTAPNWKGVMQKLKLDKRK